MKQIQYDGPKSVCLCADGPNSNHAGAGPATGHGYCTVEGCPCVKFTWDHFTPEFEAIVKAERAER